MLLKPHSRYTLILFILPILACSRGGIDLSLPPTPAYSTATPTAVPLASPTPTAWPAATSIPVPSPLLSPVPKIICPLPNLPADQHISASGSYTETQWIASGRMICQIERESCAYYKMVGLLDPTIIFKQEETPPFNTEDILLHPAMLAPLSRLSQMVLAEWAGVYQLRVTDTYDSLLEHDLEQDNPEQKYSLHFEGRATDLTLWPVDPSRYGRLCALAHCAGFDWVHHEGDHCHASINAPSLCLQCSE